MDKFSQLTDILKHIFYSYHNIVGVYNNTDRQNTYTKGSIVKLSIYSNILNVYIDD